MSFILDALKKLENKRQQESVPDLMTVHSTESQKTGKRSFMPYIVAVALILNAGILLALLRPWDREKQVLNVQSDTAQPEAISALQSGEKISNSKSNPPASEVRETAMAPINPPVENTTPEPESTEVRESAAADKNPVQDAPIKTADTEVPAQAHGDNKLASLKISPTDEELETLRNKIKEEQFSSDGSDPDEFMPAENMEVRSRSEVLELSQLPLSVRQNLPEIKISGHVFSNNPSSRIANINGSVIREGDTVTSGLKVKEITMTGIIFDYEGLRFRMRAF